MMANEHPNPDSSGKKRIDEPTGTEFVGHEWDGIEELDTPMPRWWLWCLYLSIVWAIVYVILYPAWPMFGKATEGTLGWTSRGQLAQEMNAADLDRADFRAQLTRIPTERLSDDPSLMQQAVAGGHDGFRQLHAAKVVVVAAGEEAGFGVGVEGLFDVWQHLDLAVDESGLVFVSSAVVVGEFFFRHFVGGFDDGVEGVFAVFAETLTFGEGFGVHHFVELEF